MSPARLFLFSITVCILISIGSAFLMVWFIVDSVSPQSAPIASITTAPPTLQVSKELSDLQGAIQSVAAVASQSVVSIVVTKDVPTYKRDPFGFFFEPSGTVKRKVGGGTGFFVSKDGYILTNKHVVNDPNAAYSLMLADGSELQARVLAYDPTTDLAIIRAFVDAQTPYTEAVPLSFIPMQSDIKIGSLVVAVGNALSEFQNTVTFWVVSGLGRQIQATDAWARSVEQLSWLIQTDTAINPGNSGGPLLGIDGRVIGINTAVSAGANGIGFAIPLSARTVGALLWSVIKNGQIERAFIGIKYSSLTPEQMSTLWLQVKSGALLSEVVPQSPASKAGLAAGDVVYEVDGRTIDGSFALRDGLAEKFPGDSVSLGVYKKGSTKPERISLELSARE